MASQTVAGRISSAEDRHRRPNITIRNARDGVDEFAGISCDYEVFFAEAKAHQPTSYVQESELLTWTWL
jgi:hypothetical protein